ncbi:MAG: prepilin-type N-terminal cleavage/methylation domain-containing protein [Candidatus Accumulibacter sp.]|jgi:type II secretory pathway pseudopilin PulG|nr:prepilin-type N-terminal cleavage/methylation domain-containing protein [Accumulibacter sp.]
MTARPPRSPGFTLIELLVIIAILSTVTLLAFNVSTDDRAQLRYNDTRLRLDTLERAILGRLGPAETALAGGFVADNGRLPASVAELVSDGFADVTIREKGKYGVKIPIFDARPDATTCANDGTESGGGETRLYDAAATTPHDNDAALLVKGHRSNYLGGLAFNGRFRDGWGNENVDTAEDGKNFGWGWSFDASVPQQLTIKSLGADNVADKVTGSGDDGDEGDDADGDADSARADNAYDYTADVGATILPSDWRVPLGGWTIRVTNRTGKDFKANLSASLLVFQNDAAGGHWRRYSTPASGVVCLDGDGDGLNIGASSDPCPQVTLSFPPNEKCHASATDSSTEAWIPQGRHLLVLVNHDSSGNDSIEFSWPNGNITYLSPSDPPDPLPDLSFTNPRVVTQITAVAGMPLPEARLEIR